MRKHYDFSNAKRNPYARRLKQQIFLSLALVNADDHALTIDLRGFQADGLGDPQAGGVTSAV